MRATACEADTRTGLTHSSDTDQPCFHASWSHPTSLSPKRCVSSHRSSPIPIIIKAGSGQPFDPGGRISMVGGGRTVDTLPLLFPSVRGLTLQLVSQLTHQQLKRKEKKVCRHAQTVELRVSPVWPSRDAWARCLVWLRDRG